MKRLFVIILILILGVIGLLIFNNVKALNFDKHCEDVAVTLVNSLHDTSEDFSEYEGTTEYSICTNIIDGLKAREDEEVNLTEMFNLKLDGVVDDASMYQSQVDEEDAASVNYIPDTYKDDDPVRVYSDDEIESIKHQHDLLEQGEDIDGYFYTEEEYQSIITTGKLGVKEEDSPEVYTRDGNKYIKASSLFPDILTGEYPVVVNNKTRYISNVNLKEPLSSIRTNPDFNMALSSTDNDRLSKTKKYTFKSRTTDKKVMVTIHYTKVGKISNITLGGV